MIKTDYPKSFYALLCFLALLAAKELPWAEAYCDPQVDWACYEAWCEEQGGIVYNNSSGVGCDVSGASFSSGGYSGAGYETAMMQMGVQAATVAVNSFVEGAMRAAEQQRVARQQFEQQLAEKKAAAEDEKIQQENLRWQLQEARSKELQDARAKILGEMRPIESAAPNPKPVLEVEPAQDTFNIPVLKPRRLSEVPPMQDSVKVQCGEFLLETADRKISALDLEAPASLYEIKDAAFLSHQTETLMAGGNIQVSCPEVPKVEGAPLRESQQAAQTAAEVVRKKAGAMGRLFDHLFETGEQYQEADQELKEAEKKFEEALKMRKQADERLQAVKARPAPPTEPGLPPEKDYLAEALAALEKSNQAATEAETLVIKRKGKLSQIEKQLEKVKLLADRLKKGSGETDKVLKELEQGKTGGTPAQ